MKTLIITASRYGSTRQGAEWIAERLAFDDPRVTVHAAEEAPAPDEADVVILGSGLYSHKLLPAMDEYVERHLDILRQKTLALFVLAMQTAPIFVRGRSHGGLPQLRDYFEKLGEALIHAEMLGGQMAFSQMTPQDAAGLEKFYAMLKLSPAEIEKRKAPRTLMNKADYWAFAEAVLRKAKA